MSRPERAVFGEIIDRARALAEQGEDAGSIRAQLEPIYGKRTIGSTISRLRQQGLLLAHVHSKNRPDIVTLKLQEDQWTKLARLAAARQVPAGTMAKRLFLRSLNAMEVR